MMDEWELLNTDDGLALQEAWLSAKRAEELQAHRPSTSSPIDTMTHPPTR